MAISAPASRELTERNVKTVSYVLRLLLCPEKTSYSRFGCWRTPSWEVACFRTIPAAIFQLYAIKRISFRTLWAHRLHPRPILWCWIQWWQYNNPATYTKVNAAWTDFVYRCAVESRCFQPWRVQAWNIIRFGTPFVDAVLLLLPNLSLQPVIFVSLARVPTKGPVWRFLLVMRAAANLATAVDDVR